jgi:hypothetical protein
MLFDNHKNFAYSTVATAPSPADSGTSLTVETGHGSRFPAPSFNATVWPVGEQPAVDNAEIVRITGVAGDVLTIARAQEGTSARSIVVGDQIAATITAKTLTDVENALPDLKQAESTADLTLTNVEQDIPGASITLDKAGVWLVVGTFDFGYTMAGVTRALGKLSVAGVIQTATATLRNDNSAPVRATVSQIWRISANLNDVLKLRANKVTAPANIVAFSPHTKMAALFVR